MMAGKIKNISISVHERLRNMARESSRPFNELLQNFAIERFIYRLSKSPYADRFILKGALMFLAWSGPASRPTMDIDLLGKIDNSIEKIEMVMKQACNMDVEEDGMIFHDHTVSAAGITEDAEYEGTRVRIKGNLGKARVLLQIDIGFGDVVVPGPGRVAYPVLLEFPPPELNGYTMEIPEDFNLEKFTESSFGVYQGEPVYIKIWFHPDVAGTDEIRFWTMTWGSKAVVLEPASLREEILAEAEKMASRYGAPIVGEDNRPYGVTQDRPLQRG